jgi:hypothetical protein
MKIESGGLGLARMGGGRVGGWGWGVEVYLVGVGRIHSKPSPFGKQFY